VLIVKSLYSFLGTVHWRRTGRREKQMWDNAANDCAVKVFVVGEIG